MKKLVLFGRRAINPDKVVGVELAVYVELDEGSQAVLYLRADVSLVDGLSISATQWYGEADAKEDPEMIEELVISDAAYFLYRASGGLDGFDEEDEDVEEYFTGIARNMLSGSVQDAVAEYCAINAARRSN